MHEHIFLVSYLEGLRPVWATVAAASPAQALRLVQREVLARGHEPLELLVEMLCPASLLGSPS
ncbi:MAG: hypothetical protein HS108_09180 [Planctomycetes bacterium]|jgi:hypothetical protein|nr:hypothetical protein [Planctomycetota bacterium]MCL4729710.1 hypothetical protein [Planctomycetota bacterium]